MDTLDTAPIESDARLVRGIGPAQRDAARHHQRHRVGDLPHARARWRRRCRPSRCCSSRGSLGGAIALCGGLTYAEMGAMYPRSGGLYVFLEEAYGPLTAFLFGWACMLVILTGSVATVAVGFATYFSYFVPSLSTTNQLLAVPMPWGMWSISAGQVVAAVSILALGAVNYVGVKSGNRLQATLTVVKIVALSALPIVAIALRPVSLSMTPLVPPVAQSRRGVRRGDDRGDVGVRRLVLPAVLRRRDQGPAPHGAARAPHRHHRTGRDLPVGQHRLHAGTAARGDPRRRADRREGGDCAHRRRRRPHCCRHRRGVDAGMQCGSGDRDVARVLRDGGRRHVLQVRGRGAPALSHAARRDRDHVPLVGAADADRHLRSSSSRG